MIAGTFTTSDFDTTSIATPTISIYRQGVAPVSKNMIPYAEVGGTSLRHQRPLPLPHTLLFGLLETKWVLAKNHHENIMKAPTSRSMSYRSDPTYLDNWLGERIFSYSHTHTH